MKVEDLEEEFKELIDKIDTKEERVSLFNKAKDIIINHKYQITLGILVFSALAFAVNQKDAIQNQLVKEKIVEKIVYKDRVITMGDFKCADLSGMYPIVDNKEVIYKKAKYNKLAKGLSLENGYELYITEYTPIKGK